jgi:hypothetical protein
MFLYSFFGLEIHSEVEMPDLPPGIGEPDVVIRLGSVTRTPGKATMREEIAFHARGGAFHIKDGRDIVVDPRPGADPALLRVLLAGRMMAFLLRQRGWLALHASGIEVAGEGVLFLGASGSGKSTTAAAFHSGGCEVVTDDVAAVRVDADGGCVLNPAGPRIRLLDDSRAVLGAEEPEGAVQWRKRLFDLDRADPGRSDRRGLLPIRRIYVLEYGGGICQERIQPMSAVAALSAHSFVKHWRMDEVALAAHLRDCSQVARSVPVYRLLRPRSLDALPDLVRWVSKDLEN